MTARALGLRLLHLAAAGLAVWSFMAPGARALEAAPPGPTDKAAVEAPAAADVNAVVSSGGLQMCGANAGSSATTSSPGFTVLATCQLTATQSGHVLVLANASVGLVNSGDSYEAWFRVGFDQGTTGDDRVDRFVDAHPDSSKFTNGDGTDRGVSISAFYTVTAGVHTVNFLFARSQGSNTVKAYSPSLNVLFVPDGADVLLCGQYANGNWSISSTSLISTVTCTLNAPYPGMLFVSADAWMGLANGTSPRYTSVTEIYLNGTNGGSVAPRYTDVFTNTYTNNGVDATVAATQVFTVSKGVQQVSLMVRRDQGTGSVQLRDASLVALFVPDNSAVANVCQAHTYPSWETTSSTPASMASCQLSVPQTSPVFISGSFGVGLPPSSTAIEGRFGFTYDLYSLLPSSGRYINSYPDSGDATDESAAISNVLTLAPGMHTFHLLGARFAGSGTVKVWYPVLFVLVPRLNVFVPLAIE